MGASRPRYIGFMSTSKKEVYKSANKDIYYKGGGGGTIRSTNFFNQRNGHFFPTKGGGASRPIY